MRVLLLLILLSFPALAQSARVEIDASKPYSKVSPLLYGQFLEFMFENIKQGMHAELVRARGFEEQPNVIGLPRYWERDPDDRNDDDKMLFTWDETTSYPPVKPYTMEGPEHSLKIEIKGNDGQRRGIRQGGIPIRQGVPYRAYLWARTEKYQGGLTFALERDQTGGERYAAARIPHVDGDWRQYAVDLKPTRSDPLAKLAILVEGPGTIWIDQVSLMPGDAVGTVRADVTSKVRGLKPAFFRWPGGNVAQDYWWTWGVGPRDQRKTWSNLSWKNEPEPSDFGTDEYLQYCRLLNVVPTLTVNVEGRGATAELAAEWVRYTRGKVRYWEIGNEIWGPWVRGHSDAATYAANYKKYVAAMRAVDPDLKFIAVGDNDMNWNRTVLQEVGRDIDILAVHHYYGLSEMERDPRNLMARPLFYERFYQDLKKTIEELVPGRRITLAINEWNTALPLPRQHSMESALYGARLLNVFLRTGDFIEMSCVSDLVNGWSGGVIQASRHGVFLTPTYHVNALYAARRGDEVLPVKASGPTFDSEKEGKGVPVVDVAATRTGNTVYVHAVNTDPKRAIPLELTLRGATPTGPARVETVNGPSLHASNSFAEPDTVTVKTWQSPARRIELPAHSVSVITLTVR